MDVRKIALLAGALVIAVITAVMARSMFGSAGTPVLAKATAPEVTGPQVLVATRALPVGTILQQDSFQFQPWPKELVGDAYYVQGQVPPPQPGTVVRYAITAGQPITQGALVKPGDRGFLAAALGPGMRAVTIAVDAKSGVAGFVFPGDRIDLMLTQSVDSPSGGPSLKASETFVRNIRVLATDQRTDAVTKEGKTEVLTFSTVTLEATPRIAEKVALAQSVGQISLSLRSIADNNAELERAIAAGEVDMSQAKDGKTERAMLLEIASRPSDSDPTFVTGADVSRFQRRTVPGFAAPAASAAPMAAGPSAPSSTPSAAPTGPVVKVARGNTVTVVTMGSK